MRLKKLSDLVRQLRAETRSSTSSSKGLEANEYFEQLIRRTYETLWDDYEWDHANLDREQAIITLTADEYLYALPDTVYLEGIRKVWGQDSGSQWRELPYGISLAHMNVYDSGAGEKADPVERWAPAGDGTTSKIEVWPCPATTGAKITFEGKRRPATLKDGDSLVDLDDIMVVLFAAAEALAGSQPEEANAKASAAKTRLAKMKAKAAPKTRWTMGLGKLDEDRTRRQSLNVDWNPNG
jgi:hypothetical protein